MTEENKEVKEKAESSSKKAGKPSWVKMKQEDLEKLVVELAKKGESPAKIGLILRDQHGVPRAKLLGKKITQILKEKGIEYNGEEKVFEGRVKTLKDHLSKNKKDYSASRALTKNLWVVNSFNKK